MKTWLHFIGREYYTEKGFIEEAKKYGVTRRISLMQLRAFSFGDRVLLAMADGKSSVVFGYFTLDKISGLSQEAMERIRSRFECHLVSSGGTQVERGCGSYIEGPTMGVGASLQEIVEEIKNLEDPGKLMIGGSFFELERVRLRDVSHFRGFRGFNYEMFLEAVKNCKQSKRYKYPTVSGQFYTGSPSEEDSRSGRVQGVFSYQKKQTA